jgi:hypothetical protein
MELSALSENIVSVPYQRNGLTINLQVDIDAFTPEFFHGLTERCAPLFSEETERIKAREAELKSLKPWQPDTPFGAEEMISTMVGRFKAIVGGKSGSSEPSWSLGLTRALPTLPDGSILWAHYVPVDTGSFMREAERLDIERQTHAEILSAIVKGWDVTENNAPLQPSKEVFLRLPVRVLNELWNLCLEAAQTVKKPETGEITGSQTMSETTEDGSSALRVVGGQTM